MKVLITGIAGFMGSHLADEFLKLNYEVCGIDNLSSGSETNIPQGINWLKEDLLNLNKIESYFKDVDLVVHTACSPYAGLSVFSPHYITQNTFGTTSSTLSASVKHGVKKFVYMSSMSRYGEQDSVPFVESMNPQPQDPYGIAKYASELLIKNVCQINKIDYVILVPHNIIGSRQRYDDPFRNVASIMINRMLQGKQPIIYGDGNQMRCFSFWKDVSDAIIMACNTNKVNGEIVNIGPDEEYITINKLASIISELINFDLNPIYMPERPQEVKYANCSADLARNKLEYQSKVNLRDGLLDLITWIKENNTKEFNYNLSLEFITKKTPTTWTERLI